MTTALMWCEEDLFVEMITDAACQAHGCSGDDHRCHSLEGHIPSKESIIAVE